MSEIYWFDEATDFGSAPLFPKSAGEALHAILNPAPVTKQHGPPWTHTFRPPPTEYDEDGEPIWQPPEPTMTITRSMPAAAWGAEHPLREPDLHPLLLDHDIDRSVQ